MQNTSAPSRHKAKNAGGLLRRVTAGIGLAVVALAAVWVSISACSVAAQPALELRGTLGMAPQAHVAGIIAISSSAMMAFPWRSLLLCIHIFGLALGFGSALFLDFFLLRHLYSRAISGGTIETVMHGQRLVSIGLALLWFSGIGFFCMYYATDPDKLANPKLWVKVAVVSVLTLNGMLIHALVLPRLVERMGKPLLKGQTLRDAAVPLTVAAISGASWVFAAMLGLVKELNGTIPGAQLMLAYCGVVALAVLGAAALHLLSGGKRPSQRPASLLSMAP